MKNILLFLLLIALSQLNAQVDSLGCTGALGDAKYSILDLEDFQDANGDCWQLMAGQSVAGSSKLGMLGISQVPDGRGYFIRAHDTRISDRVDVDRSNTTPIGTIQEDEFKSHDHNIANKGLMTKNIGFGTLVTATGFDATNDEGNIKDNAVNMPTAGGSETRPKNINLYLYIRIN